MATELLPPLGASGTWVLKTPFDTKLTSGLAYTAKEIRKITAAVGAGVDVFKEYYEPNGLSQDVMDAHVAADNCIITLISSVGTYVYVPSPYIASWPSGDSVPYVVMGMAIKLGAIANTIDPTFLTDKVKNVIVANLGLEPVINFVTLSEEERKTWSDHQSLENARTTLITDSNTDYARRVKAEDDLAKARQQIALLNQYILDKGIGPPTTTP